MPFNPCWAGLGRRLVGCAWPGGHSGLTQKKGASSHTGRAAQLAAARPEPISLGGPSGPRQ
ncbi:unnamed protein product [Spirodela intermedia]|uniref:Uncharacterized protein n=1 Tax=Spirodela intermedia TaxID=51605 RepID=A0A7I8JHU5_SPIIN|nr:unnamed protein product [Spirodela intermedia]CAA6669491.1 unnamed protein product [Spirodela intermedia]